MSLLDPPPLAANVRFQQSGTGSVPRSSQDKMREGVSAKDFGAKGDGVTDDTASIASAYVAASNVHLPLSTGDYQVTSISVPADSALLGNLRSKLRTSPAAGRTGGLQLASANNNQLLYRIKMLPASGAASHNGVEFGLMNGAQLQESQITGYAGAASVWMNASTAIRINGGQIGNASDIGVALTGATNDCVLSGVVMAYPTYCGYYLGTGSQANTIQGGETATLDGGVPIMIDRSNGVTVTGHNTESQATGGTPATFYSIGSSSGMVSNVTGVGGSGYTDGVYMLTATGGTGLPPRILATIASGAVSARTILFPGYGIGSAWTLALPAAAGAGTGATFVQTMGSTTGVHNTKLRNNNVIANKGNVANMIEVQSPVFGLDIDGFRVNATKITGSLVKFNTTNVSGRVRDMNSSSKGAGVADIQIAAEAGFFGGGSYNIGTVWDFNFNKGQKYLLAGTQARSNFPTTGRAAVIDMRVATDTNVAPYAVQVTNGDPHVTTFDPTVVSGPPVTFNNAVAGGRITAMPRKKLRYTGDFTAVLFVRISSLGSGFCGIAQRQGSWVLRGSQNNTTLPQTPQAQVTIGGSTFSITGTTNLSANTWAMVAIRRNNAEGRLYVHVNDQFNFVGSVPTTALDGSSGNHLFFNRDASSSASFLGDIALISEYDRALTMGELRFLYEAQATALGLSAWGTADVAADPGTTNLQLKLDPAAFVSANSPLVPDSSPNAYNTQFFGASKGEMLTARIDAKNGQVQYGNGVDLEGAPHRPYGVLDDDPITPADGDIWIRGDLAPSPELRVRIAGTTYRWVGSV